MSADNGLLVEKLFTEPGYGIFHYFASGDDRPVGYYNKQNAREVFATPLAAIVAAHSLQRVEMTEYGVSVSDRVISRAAEHAGALEAMVTQ